MNDVAQLSIEYRYIPAAEVKEMQAIAVVEEVWNKLPWGSYGPEGTDSQKVRMLGELDTDHLEAIIITQPQILPFYRTAILELLKKRYKEQD